MEHAKYQVTTKIQGNRLSEKGAEVATHAEACNLFGHSYQHWQKGLASHPADPELVIWFPRFYENDEWQTWISGTEETIYERRVEDNDGYVEWCLGRPGEFKRLVFAAVKRGKYRFEGLFEIDPKASRSTSTITYRRIATRTKTYNKTS